MPEKMETAIRNYIAGRMTEKLDTLHKKRDGDLKKVTSPSDEVAIQAEYADEEAKIRVKFFPRNWLDDAAKRAKQISMATHAIKFTHSSAKGSNILYLQKNEQPQYLDSSCLADPIIDAVGNAAALDVAKFLQLETGSGNLAGLLANGDYSALNSFSENNTEIEVWVTGFLHALEDSSPASHTLAKQVYFPVDENKYHLLSPLYSSSLSQEIYNRIQFSRFAQESKEARKAKKNGAYSATPVLSFPNVAVTVSGGSKPQNISQKNSGRGGRTYLFPATPPVWQTQVKPPIYLENFFTYKQLNNQTYGTVRKLANFLEKIFDLESNLRIRRYRARLVDEIVDTILNISCSMAELPANWTDKANLPSHQKAWLDSGFPSHQSSDWYNSVASDFADWLNGKLKKITIDKLTLAKTENEFWRDTFLQGIRDTRAGRRS
jgi:CRISPR-associated protein Csy1